MSTTVVQYRVKGGQGDVNQALIEAVFAELTERQPTGFRYGTIRLDDDVTFVHIARTAGANPLEESLAFAAFQAELADRCEEGPTPVTGTVIGNYQLYAGSSQAAEVAVRYLTAFANGDIETTRSVLADDFTFRGPMAQIDGADVFIAETAPLTSMADGIEIHRLFEDGDEVCAIFDFRLATPAGKGAVRMCEWITVEDGVVTSSRLVFDTAAFMAVLPSG